MDNFDDKYKKKNPFTVPERYFEGLTDRITVNVEKKQKLPKKQKPGLIRLVKPYMGLAALFLLALLVIQVLFPLVVDKSQFIRSDRGMALQSQEMVNEDIFDSQFNPTTEEIIEYLTLEVDSYDFLYAGNY